jgi:hypothetical protein
MLGVDRSWFVERCPDCDHYEDVIELRIFTIPVHRERSIDEGMKERVAIDLGVPCIHPHLDRWHKHRYWGLLVCAAPCINGVIRIVGDDWYDKAAAAKARRLAASDPSISARFQIEVLSHHNEAVWWEVQGLIRPPAQPPN